MALNLIDYEIRTAEAIKQFWKRRREGIQGEDEASTRPGLGERFGVLAGKNMDGFADLILALASANGLADVDVFKNRPLVSLPGYFRPTKQWDLVLLHRGRLLAAIELKSHVGPSFGNNFNNRTEEAIGSSHDFWLAFREGAFGAQPRPFLGWLMLVEDAEGSRKAVRDRSPHFGVFKDFERSSYLSRYDSLCKKLVQEQLYTSASLIASPRSAIETGEYTDLSEITSLKFFVTMLAGHLAAEAALSSRE